MFLVFWETIPTSVGTLKGNLVQEQNLVCYGKLYWQYVWIIVYSLSNFLNFTMYEDMFQITSMGNNFMRIVKFQVIHCVRMSWALCFVQLHMLHYIWGYVSSYLYEKVSRELGTKFVTSSIGRKMTNGSLRVKSQCVDPLGHVI